jgi:hypothetical protein
MFYIGFINVQLFPEDDQDRSKHVGVVCKNIIVTLLHLLALFCELLINARTRITKKKELTKTLGLRISVSQWGEYECLCLSMTSYGNV